MFFAHEKAIIEIAKQEELIMDEENQDYYLEKELLELREQFLQLNQELEDIQKLLQRRRISPKQFLLFVKFLIVILIGLNVQKDNFQFSGEQILPMVETLTSTQEVETNFN